MVGRQGGTMAQRSAIAQLLQNVHGGALLDSTPRKPGSRRLSLDSCRHQEGKTRVYVRSRDLNSARDPVVKGLGWGSSSQASAWALSPLPACSGTTEAEMQRMHARRIFSVRGRYSVFVDRMCVRQLTSKGDNTLSWDNDLAHDLFSESVRERGRDKAPIGQNPLALIPCFSLDDGGEPGLVRQCKSRSAMGFRNTGTYAILPLGLVEKETERLRAEVEEVNRTLTYIRAVVQQKKLEILPHSATLILDTIMNVFNTLRNTPAAADSTPLMSCQSKVCQSLARFIHWTDSLLLGSQGAFDTASANEIIGTLSAGIKELSQLWLDKMATHKTSAQKSPNSQGSLLAPPQDGVRRVSLPDIPLTPREQEILDQTSDLGAGSYDNVSTGRVSTISGASTVSGASDVFTFDQDHFGGQQPGPIPPPKPPLPAGANHILPKLLQQHQGDGAGVSNGDDTVPPPLPQKRRSHNDMLSSMGSLSSMGGSISSGQTTPTGSPHTSLITSISSEPAINSLAHSTSPGSSQSSNLNLSSSEDLNSLPGGATVVMSRSSHSSVFSRTSSESRIISSTIVPHDGRISGDTGGAGGGGKTFEEINALTSEIKRLTSSIEDIPPPLPAKKGTLQRLMSQYDNMPETGIISSSVSSSSSSVTSRTVVNKTIESTSRFSSASSSQSSLQRASHSAASFLSEERASSSTHEAYSSSETFSSASHSSTESLPRPPPLPPKKRHIHAYMQTFGALTQPLSLENISRHSINFYEAQWQQHQMELCQPLYPRSNTISVFSDISSDSSFSSGSPERFSGVAPALPAKTRRSFDINRGSQVSTGSSQSEASSFGDFAHSHSQSHGTLNLVDLEPKRWSGPPQTVETPQPQTPTPTATATATTITSNGSNGNTSPSVTVSASTKPEITRDGDSDFAELNPLDDIDVSDQLIRKKEGEDGPEIRGGSIDALIVHATAAGKTEFMYQEAFLTTYRTFISPRDLIDKLLYRFHKFHHAVDGRKKLSRNSFSLLIRVIDELGHTELEEEIVERQVALVYELLCQCELGLARLLRRKVLEKCEQKQAAQDAPPPVNPVQSIDLSSNTPDLLSFKSGDIAEQMTLLDAQLFQQIEIPEVLLWARVQSEEQSPHLTTFTEHFNKMSYWCRTRILTQEDPKEREKYLMKFIKIMRWLRKLKNFNSYLAILSALDSAPVRRLEWQKQNIEALQEFCQLIDSSSSFRAYRQALAETEPPCIPYLGLILQDLTFINIGNQDMLPDGSINFAKRWQQFNILDSMRRFKTSHYGFKRNDKIQALMNNFDEYLGEEILWQMSQKIKPRPTHKKQDSIT
ncbi:hypothetical protein BaRGS_00004315 [Batillaria attramentaria]|uniref:CRK SH3-binding GNRP n=1 Tax=Batillaria attramentaria TaxID=370345 RepID=A0ABD0LYD1_9CAEN